MAVVFGTHGKQVSISDESLLVVPVMGDIRPAEIRPLIALQMYGMSIYLFTWGWATRFDRDLSVAGRVLVKRGSKVVHEVVKINRPILRIPNLAIHLTSGDERSSFAPNLQNHFPPILATGP